MELTKLHFYLLDNLKLEYILHFFYILHTQLI